MATYLRTFVGNYILVPYGIFLMIKPLLRFGLTRLIHPRPLSIPISLPKLGVLNLLRIHHEPRNIHIINEHCRTMLFFHQSRHPNHKLVHPRPSVWYYGLGILIELVEYNKVLFHTNSPLMEVHEFH